MNTVAGSYHLTATDDAADPVIPDPAALYRALLDSHPEPTFALGVDGSVMECNRAFVRFVGRGAEGVVGTRLRDLVLEPQREAADRACACVAGGTPHSWHAEFIGPDESVSVGHVTLAPVRVNGRIVGAQGIARDVTVYHVIEEQLQARVFTDPLTGLASRTHLQEAVERAFRRSSSPSQVAVLFVDIDDFKMANDALGHAVGDAMLNVVADRLRSATRGQDLVARLGADEFAVLLDGLAAPEDVLLVVERIHGAMRVPIDLDGRPLPTTVSLGIAHWDGTATPTELLRNADLAMYRAKSFGKGRHVVYDSNMQAAARERLELASDLRDAIRGGALEAAFQPIVDLHTGRVLKAEALARWVHPTRGPIPPGVFIPLAEDTGLVDDLGALMLHLGCRQLRAWEVEADVAGMARDARIGVTVNVSGRQIDNGTLVPAVRAALEASGADPAGLTLELTESVAMRQPERLLQMLSELAGLGLTLAIDDFGTGYSSLSYLHRFPVDILKIDKSFVDGLGATPVNAHAETMVRTIVSIAAALELRTVAEGVETAEQRDALKALGCEMAQGYLFGRPGPASAIPGTGVAP